MTTKQLRIRTAVRTAFYAPMIAFGVWAFVYAVAR